MINTINITKAFNTYSKLVENTDLLNLDYEIESSIYDVYLNVLTQVLYNDGITNTGGRIVEWMDVKTRALEFYGATISKQASTYIANELNR